jgi:hypothetical protein
MGYSFALIEPFMETQGGGGHNADCEEGHGKDIGADHFESDSF